MTRGNEGWGFAIVMGALALVFLAFALSVLVPTCAHAETTDPPADHKCPWWHVWCHIDDYFFNDSDLFYYLRQQYY